MNASIPLMTEGIVNCAEWHLGMTLYIWCKQYFYEVIEK